MAHTRVVHIPAHPPRADVTHPESLLDGIAKRMAYKPPKYDKLLRRRFRRFVKNWLEKNLKPIEHNEELGFEDWLETTNYPEWRKKELREVYDKMLEDDSFFANELDRCHKNADVKIFTKEENYPEYKYPRAIWARVDAFKDISGPFFKTIEKKVFALPYFIKKIPKKDRPAYIQEFVEKQGLKYVASDFTSFESLFTTDLQDDCEYQLYRYMSTKNDFMRRVCRMIINVIGGDNIAMNKYFKIAVNAKRMSGEMNTSLGNGFSNLMILLFAVHENNIGHSGPVVEGDDGLMGISKPIPPEFFTKMGLNVKMLNVDTVYEASFCGIIFDGDELINVTDPIDPLCTLLWVSRKYNFTSDATYFSLIKSKALSLAYEYPGCPIISVLAKRVLELLVDYEFRAIHEDRWKALIAQQALKAMNSNEFPTRCIGPRSRELMEKHFGVPATTQEIIEAKINKMTLSNWDYSDIIPLLPPVWLSNYDIFTREWSQITYSINHPDFPMGEMKNITINRGKFSQLRGMSKLMTKKQYMAVNQANFAKLTEKEKNERFKDYVERKKDKNLRMKKFQGQVPAPKSTYNKQKPTRNARPKQTTVGLSKCAILYAKASINPFQQLDDDPCIPDSVSVPSYKFNTTVMVTMTVGTQGAGYALLDPWTAIVNDNVKNDCPVACSTAGFNSTNLDLNTGDIGAQYDVFNSNSFFNGAQFDVGELRLVAAGLQVFYTGPILNQAGVVTTLQNDGGATFGDLQPIVPIMQNPRSVTCANLKENMCYVSYLPTSTDEFSYKPYSQHRPSTAGLPYNYPLGIFVTGAVPGTTFQVRARCYYEAQIPGLSATSSDSDPIGFAAVQTARTQLKPTEDPAKDQTTVLQQALRNIGQTISGIAPSVGTAIGTVFGAPQLGSAAGSTVSALLNGLLTNN